jgi:hypothetical protein
MSRIRIVGVSLLAAFGFAAMVASSAYAGEYGECVKAAKVGGKATGAYLDSRCEKPASPAQVAEGKLNKFRWQAVQPANRLFTAKGATAVVDWAAGELVCTKSTATGEVLGWQKSLENITFTGCALERGATHSPENCWSEAFPETSLTITANTLDGYLLDHGTRGPGGLAPDEGEVWDELASTEHQPYLAEFECRSEREFRIGGTVSGVLAPAGKGGTLKFGATAGEQDLTTETSLDHGKTWEHPEASTLAGTVTVKFKSKVEARACNDAGAAAEGKGAVACEHEELPAP